MIWMGNPRKYLASLLWALGLSILWCLVTLPTVNIDAGMTIPGPDGEDYVVKASLPQVIFFTPGFLLMQLSPIPIARNLISAVGFSLAGWTIILFFGILLTGNSVRLLRSRL